MPKIIEFETQPTLEELQKAVGGYIEVIPYFETYKGRKCTALCNEDGKQMGFQRNAEATKAWYDQMNSIDYYDYLVGDIAIVYGGLD